MARFVEHRSLRQQQQQQQQQNDGPIVSSTVTTTTTTVDPSRYRQILWLLVGGLLVAVTVTYTNDVGTIGAVASALATAGSAQDKRNATMRQSTRVEMNEQRHGKDKDGVNVLERQQVDSKMDNPVGSSDDGAAQSQSSPPPTQLPSSQPPTQLPPSSHPPSSQPPSSQPALSFQEEFDEAFRATSNLLYRNSSDRSLWSDKPPPRVYIYENILPPHLSDPHNISQCIMDGFQSHMKDSNYTDCPWFPTICNDQQSPTPFQPVRVRFMGQRYNYNNDVAWIDWFQTVYPHTTNDPVEADFFLVPYPHWSHCQCQKAGTSQNPTCPYTFQDWIEPTVLQQLPYYNTKTKERHLVILGADFGLVQPAFRNSLSFTLSIGPAQPCVATLRSGRPCGHLVVPYVSTGRQYQPLALTRYSQEWWTRRSRRYSLSAILGSPKQLKWRTEFLEHYPELLNDDNNSTTPTMNGLPYNITNLGKVRIPIRQDQAAAIYRESVFCLILPGDGCAQKRFLDVLHNGCIPLVPRFDTSDDGTAYPTFYTWTGACSIRTTYPFAKGTFLMDRNAGIDYESLVLSWNGTCGLGCIRNVVVEALRDPKRIERIRQNIRTVVSLLNYNLKEDTVDNSDGRSTVTRTSVGTASPIVPDAFLATMVSIRHYLSRLSKNSLVRTKSALLGNNNNHGS